MQIHVVKSKIHRVQVTGADLNYIGSITIDEDLMDAAGLKEYEKIQILDITNGNRIETYIIRGERGSGQVCINGAAAHLILDNEKFDQIGLGSGLRRRHQLHKGTSNNGRRL